MPNNDTSTKQEYRLIRFLKTLGFVDVDGGSPFVVGGRQIDAVAGYETTLFIFECTTQTDNLVTKIDQFRGNAGEKIRALKQHETYTKYRKYRLVFVLQDQLATDSVMRRAEQQKPEILIWDDSLISYYRSLQRAMKEYAKYSLLTEMNVRPDNPEKDTIPAFSLELTGRHKYRLFVFSVLATTFMKYAYVARRQIGADNYYQRMIKTSRLEKIGRYIDKGMIFPNSIVVAIRDNSFSYVADKTARTIMPSWQSFGSLTLSNNFNTCWIIDGQHRLYGHAHTTSQGRILVTAFANMSENKQAEYFLDINREAQKVDANLLWDILGSINPKSKEGIISNAVKQLRTVKKGFFYDKINIPSLGKGKFSFNNICSAIQDEGIADKTIGRLYDVLKNPLWDEDADKMSMQIANLLSSFFVSLDNHLSPDSRERLYSDGFVAVFISIFKLDVAYLHKRPTNSEIDALMVPLSDYLNQMSDEDASRMRKGLASAAGRTDLRNDFVKFLQENFNKSFGIGLNAKDTTLADLINQLELRFNSMANLYLTAKYGPEWIMDQKVMRNHEERKEILARAKVRNTEPWEHLNFLSTINNLILDNDHWMDFQPIFRQAGIQTRDEVRIYASKIWEYRSNKHGHNRARPVIYPREEENLIRSIYQLFRKVIEIDEKQNIGDIDDKGAIDAPRIA